MVRFFPPAFRRRVGIGLIHTLALSLAISPITLAQTPDPASSERDAPQNDAPLAISNAAEAPAIASQVVIHRDTWGVAHVFGETDEATIFGTAYAQAEDYFWQVEDNCIRATGRYCEVHGEGHLKSDLLNRMFEIPKTSQADFERLAPFFQKCVVAFADGLNYYLATHPDVKPRLIERFEPWHIVAMDRHFLMEFCYGRTHAGTPKPIRKCERIPQVPSERNEGEGARKTEATETSSSRHNPRAQVPKAEIPGARLASWDWQADTLSDFEQGAQLAVGSNAWAISPQRTQSGNAMLLINPHQPWYGWGQFYEVHMQSKSGLHFTGASFYGNPIPVMGHNEKLGWAYTVNDPDVADAWRVTFDDPANPLHYRYDGGYRTAREWTDTISVRKAGQIETFEYVFRATHHGPIAKKNNDQVFTAVQIAGILSLDRATQAFHMIRAQNFEQWHQAFQQVAIPMFNCVYADTQGNIFYCYNGSIPIRDARHDWTQPVDGSLPSTDWQGIHPLEDLPQVLNPKSGFVQNCNSSPFVTTDDGNPSRGDFPGYMFEDADHDKRRAKLSRMLLRDANNLSFQELKALATDTRLYWPIVELPNFQRDFKQLAATDPERADRIRPYLEHLLDWNCRASCDSTQMLLCLAWYEELYGLGYPAETLQKKYQTDRFARLDALRKAAEKVEAVHGKWKVPWGDVHRLTRVTKKAGVMEAALSMNRLQPSLPCPGGPGPLGVVFTVYSSPTVRFIRPHRYAVVGNSYLAAIEFSDPIQAASLTPFGASADRNSDHFFDQAGAFSKGELKPAWFYTADVLKNAKRSYRLSAPFRELKN